MAKVSLSGMDIQSLMDLRKRIDERLLECRADIEKQLARLDRSIGDETIGLPRGRVSSLRGGKVPPKYRGPSGQTWAGPGRGTDGNHLPSCGSPLSEVHDRSFAPSRQQPPSQQRSCVRPPCPSSR